MTGNLIAIVQELVNPSMHLFMNFEKETLCEHAIIYVLIAVALTCLVYSSPKYAGPSSILLENSETHIGKLTQS